MPEKTFNVIGIDDLEGMVFARCTTFEKAQKAKRCLKQMGLKICWTLYKTNF